MWSGIATGSIGIDLGGAVVRAVQLDRAGRLEASLELERTAPAEPYTPAECARIVGAMRRAGFTGGAGQATAPKPMLRSTSIELPPLDSGAPIEQIARGELARVLGLETGGFEFTLWMPDRADQNAGARPMAVVCEHEQAMGVLSSFLASGIEIGELVPTGLAIAALPGADTRAVLDVGWSNAAFYVVRSGAVLFERSIRSLGFGGVAEELAEQLEVPLTLGSWCGGLGRQEHPQIAQAAGKVLHRFGQRLADEVGSSIAYARRCWPDAGFETMHVVGGGGADAELCEWLGINLGVLVEPLGGEGFAGLGPAFSAAAGVARRGMHRGAGRRGETGGVAA